MRCFLLFVLVFMQLNILTGQNLDAFEDWETINGFEIPKGWEINNASPGYPCSSRIVNETDGSYALRLRSRGPSFEGAAPGYAFKKFYIPTSSAILIAADINVDSILDLFPGGFGAFQLYSSQNNYTHLIASWQVDTVTNGFVHVELPIEPNLLPDTLAISFVSGTTLGPLGYNGYSEIIVDNLSMIFDVSATQFLGDSPLVQVFPNPSNGNIQIKTTEIQLGSAQLAALDGRGITAWKEVSNGRFDAGRVPPGIYFLKIKAKDNQLITKRIVIQ